MKVEIIMGIITTFEQMKATIESKIRPAIKRTTKWVRRIFSYRFEVEDDPRFRTPKHYPPSLYSPIYFYPTPLYPSVYD